MEGRKTFDGQTRKFLRMDGDSDYEPTGSNMASRTDNEIDELVLPDEEDNDGDG